nr:type IV secretion system protein [Neisseria flavescens]
MCLLFKRTAPLFQKWLYFGLATIFSSVLLGVMAEISMDLVGHLFGGAAAGKFVATVIGEGGTTGIMETVTQQLGLGLMLSTLLITVPPMAGMWFNGVMGSFSAYSVIGNGNRQEVPPHLDGGASRQINYNAQNRASNAADNDNYDSSQRNLWTTGGIQQTGSTTTDAMKQLGQPGKGSNPS